MSTFEFYKYELIVTAIILVSYFIIKKLISKSIERVAQTFEYQKPRVKIIKKLFTIVLFSICFSILLFIWGVDRSELVFFITSMLTVIGIAFFAQWSIISNVTSTLIIYFNHPAKIGDTIEVMDKEFPIVARISDIGAFFVTLKTVDGEVITIPNNVFIQKTIKLKS